MRALPRPRPAPARVSGAGRISHTAAESNTSTPLKMSVGTIVCLHSWHAWKNTLFCSTLFIFLSHHKRPQWFLKVFVQNLNLCKSNPGPATAQGDIIKGLEAAPSNYIPDDAAQYLHAAGWPCAGWPCSVADVYPGVNADGVMRSLCAACPHQRCPVPTR